MHKTAAMSRSGPNFLIPFRELNFAEVLFELFISPAKDAPSQNLTFS